MGETSKRLHNKLKKKAAPLNLPTGKMRGRADMPSIEAWIRQGMDPVHAAYAFVQHITSAFAEGVSQLYCRYSGFSYKDGLSREKPG